MMLDACLGVLDITYVPMYATIYLFLYGLLLYVLRIR